VQLVPARTPFENLLYQPQKVQEVLRQQDDVILFCLSVFRNAA